MAAASPEGQPGPAATAARRRAVKAEPSRSSRPEPLRGARKAPPPPGTPQRSLPPRRRRQPPPSPRPAAPLGALRAPPPAAVQRDASTPVPQPHPPAAGLCGHKLATGTAPRLPAPGRHTPFLACRSPLPVARRRPPLNTASRPPRRRGSLHQKAGRAGGGRRTRSSPEPSVLPCLPLGAQLPAGARFREAAARRPPRPTLTERSGLSRGRRPARSGPDPPCGFGVCFVYVPS